MNALTAPTAPNVLTVLNVLTSPGLATWPSGQGLAKQPLRGRSLSCIFLYTSCWLVLATGALSPAQSLAVETSAAAASALKVLSMPLNETRSDSAATSGTATATGQKDMAGPSSSGLSITVQKGESIDAVIRRGLPRLPLKDDLLRQALAKANPKIFPKGQTYPVKPGTVLMLPSLDDLRQMITVQYPEMVLLLQKTAAEPADEAPKGPDKRQWVRFP